MIQNKPGIYKILCKVNGKIYIGSSSRVKDRLSSHKLSLSKNEHSNTGLQDDYNAYGWSCFEASVIEYCNDNDKLKREKYYMEDVYNCLNTTNGYNVCPIYITNGVYKQHVPKKYLSTDTIKIAKILLSLNVPVSGVARILGIRWNDIKNISSFYNYSDVYSEYNEYILHPNPKNLHKIIYDGMHDDIISACKDRNNLLFEYSPIIFFDDFSKFMDSECSVSLKKKFNINVLPRKQYLSYSELQYIFSVNNELQRKILYFVVINSYEYCGLKLSYFSEIEFCSFFNCTSNVDFIYNVIELINSKRLKIDVFNMCYVPLFDDVDSAQYINVYDNIILSYEFAKNVTLGLKQNIGICKKCGNLFQYGKTKKSLYCYEHRSQVQKTHQNKKIKKNYSKIYKCENCGKEFYRARIKKDEPITCFYCRKVYNNKKYNT